jgi:hypothetical protein
MGVQELAPVGRGCFEPREQFIGGEIWFAHA